MKNKKWLTYALGILLTLVVLVAVGGAGFCAGMMQNAVVARNFDGTGPAFAHDFPNNGAPHNTQGHSRGNDFDNRGVGHGRGGMPPFGGLFGLIHIAILALLAWFGYKLAQKSGWRVIRVQTAPATTEAPNAKVEEKREEETSN